MDLTNLYAQQVNNQKNALPVRLLAPVPNVIPTDDGVIEYVTVHTLSDIINAAAQVVMLFEEDDHELLDVLVNHPDLFGFTCMVLSGLPAADYSAAFESKTYMLERVSFATLVNDLVERKRAAAALADESASDYDKERTQFTRKSGHIKELTGIKLAGAPDPNEPMEADE